MRAAAFRALAAAAVVPAALLLSAAGCEPAGQTSGQPVRRGEAHYQKLMVQTVKNLPAKGKVTGRESHRAPWPEPKDRRYYWLKLRVKGGFMLDQRVTPEIYKACSNGETLHHTKGTMKWWCN